MRSHLNTKDFYRISTASAWKRCSLITTQPAFVLYDTLIEAVRAVDCLCKRRNCRVHVRAKGRTCEFARHTRAACVEDACYSYALLAGAWSFNKEFTFFACVLRNICVVFIFPLNDDWTSGRPLEASFALCVYILQKIVQVLNWFGSGAPSGIVSSWPLENLTISCLRKWQNIYTLNIYIISFLRFSTSTN